MYNPKDIQFAGKHDYDKARAEIFSSIRDFSTFSIPIFKWVLANSGKNMKKSKTIVRITGPISDRSQMFEFAEKIVYDLDNGTWDGRKTVKYTKK